MTMRQQNTSMYCRDKFSFPSCEKSITVLSQGAEILKSFFRRPYHDRLDSKFRLRAMVGENQQFTTVVVVVR